MSFTLRLAVYQMKTNEGWFGKICRHANNGRASSEIGQMLSREGAGKNLLEAQRDCEQKKWVIVLLVLSWVHKSNSVLSKSTNLLFFVFSFLACASESCSDKKRPEVLMLLAMTNEASQKCFGARAQFHHSSYFCMFLSESKKGIFCVWKNALWQIVIHSGLFSLHNSR